MATKKQAKGEGPFMIGDQVARAPRRRRPARGDWSARDAAQPTPEAWIIRARKRGAAITIEGAAGAPLTYATEAEAFEAAALCAALTAQTHPEDRVAFWAAPTSGALALYRVIEADGAVREVANPEREPRANAYRTYPVARPDGTIVRVTIPEN